MVLRDRPVMPDGYGVPETLEGILDWDAVEARLVAARVYWLATIRPDGRPHVVPRWGVWHDRRFYYDGAPTTVHSRNRAADPRTVLHLEDGTQAVIVEGTATAVSPPARDLAEVLSAAFTAKYGDDGYAPEPDAWSGEGAGGLGVLVPAKAMAWFAFPTDVTRFRF